MDYTLNVILVVCGAFVLLTIALLLWIANLLLEVERLQRELRKAHAWHDNWMVASRRKERLER